MYVYMYTYVCVHMQLKELYMDKSSDNIMDLRKCNKQYTHVYVDTTYDASHTVV